MTSFGRIVRLEYGEAGSKGVAAEGLRVSFKVERSTSARADAVEIQVYNLAKRSRALLEQRGTSIALFAGYGQAGQIFSGMVEEVVTASSGTDRVTTIEASDGGFELRGRLSESFRGPVSALTLFRRIAARASLPIAVEPVGLNEVMLKRGLTVQGRIGDTLDDLAKTLSCRFFVQDGGIVLVPFGEVADLEGPLISPSTGLIGSPAEQDDGSVKLTSLLLPRVVPGVRFQLDSSVDGFFRATKVTHVGDTGFDSAFYSEIIAQPFEVK